MKLGPASLYTHAIVTRDGRKVRVPRHEVIGSLNDAGYGHSEGDGCLCRYCRELAA